MIMGAGCRVRGMRVCTYHVLGTNTICTNTGSMLVQYIQVPAYLLDTSTATPERWGEGKRARGNSQSGTTTVAAWNTQVARFKGMRSAI